MALAKNVEKRIWDIEGFAVIIRHGDGRDMRGDRQGIRMYNFSRMAKGNIPVAAWKSQRFHPDYGGLDVDILDGSGSLLTVIRSCPLYENLMRISTMAYFATPTPPRKR